MTLVAAPSFPSWNVSVGGLRVSSGSWVRHLVSYCSVTGLTPDTSAIKQLHFFNSFQPKFTARCPLIKLLTFRCNDVQVEKCRKKNDCHGSSPASYKLQRGNHMTTSGRFTTEQRSNENHNWFQGMTIHKHPQTFRARTDQQEKQAMMQREKLCKCLLSNYWVALHSSCPLQQQHIRLGCASCTTPFGGWLCQKTCNENACWQK